VTVKTVNLANGNLNLHFPLVTIGGRGSASYTVALNYNSKVWTGQKDTETIGGGPFGDPPTTLDHFAAAFDDLTGRIPNAFYLGGGWSILKSPSIRKRLVDIEALPPAACPGIQGVTLYKYGLTKVWLVMPDGSEIEMRDAATDGAPYLRPSPCTLQGDGARGRVWKSVDGSAITYITDVDNGATTGQLAGNVFLSDGTKLVISGSGRCTKMIDRNGNVLDFTFAADGSVTYTDQLGRQVIVTGGTTGATVTIKGYNGVADRSFTIEMGQVAPLDNSLPAPNLRADYQNTALWPRPFTSGDLINSLSFGVNQHGVYGNTPHTDLFLMPNPDPTAVNNSDVFAGETVISSTEVSVVTKLNLLDGRSFVFRYNPWGEVSEIVYPGGGVTRIEYAAVGSAMCEGGPLTAYSAENGHRFRFQMATDSDKWPLIPGNGHPHTFFSKSFLFIIISVAGATYHP
jgi:hypothetical protein